jgi:2-polyprenyl-3-methyl-5-hydroxy-6-metoxy-1,4-benzoquinol methylase
MANERGKAIDKTFLSVDNAEERGFLHRDYIAHCLRWTHVVKWLHQGGRYKTARILDVGCGKEMPLAKLMHSSRLGPQFYAAADVSKLSMPEQFAKSTWKPSQLLGECDAAVLKREELEQVPNTIVCFEVAEHIEPEHCRRLLTNFGALLEDDGTLFISTPCWDPDVGAAANHVNEMTYLAFGSLLEDIGWRVEGHWGTFASMRDYKDQLPPAHKEVFDAMRDYYDSNYLATIFAPLYPQYSRNCLWQLKWNPGGSRQFPDLRDVEGRWGSSEKWRELLA